MRKIFHIDIMSVVLRGHISYLFRRRNLALSAKHVQEMTNSRAQLVAQFTHGRAACAKRQMGVEKLLLRSLIDQNKAHICLGGPLREVSDAGCSATITESGRRQF